MEHEWAGDLPFYLLIEHTVEGEVVSTGIDLDFPQWGTHNLDLMRKPGCWFLVHKETNSPVLGQTVAEGEQPYFVIRQVGRFSTATGQSTPRIPCFGIGKKLLDGSVQRLWLLPNGMVVAGEEAEHFAERMLR